MNEIWHYAALGLLTLIALFLFFRLSRTQRDAEELQADLQQAQYQLGELSQKYEGLTAQHHEVRHWAIQQETLVQVHQARLQERDDQLTQLENKLLAAMEAENRLERTINELSTQVGESKATAEGLLSQLHDKQADLHLKVQENQTLQNHLTASRQQLAQLTATLEEKQRDFEQRQREYLEIRQQLNNEFQHLAQKVLDEKSKHFSESNQSALELLLKPFKDQIEGFQKRVNEVHSEAIKGNANLEAEIKRVLEIGLTMSQDAQNLTSALKGNNKIAGNWGEVQLESALQSAGLLAGEHYLAQESYRNEEGKRFAPDFVVKLPDNKHLVLDSKVSLVAYDQAVRSQENIATQRFLDEHSRSLRQHIDGLSNKNYNSLIGIKSPDFVLMFVPIEPAYIEAMKQDPQLFNYGYQKNVILVSHTTLMPILRTVANLWRIERGNSEAREIGERAGDIYNQVCLIAERLAKLGNTFNSAANQYNQTVTALVGKQGLLGKVERFQQLSNKAHQAPPQIELLHNDAEAARLIIEKVQEQGE